MKKILITISIFMLLICAGCVPKLNPIETGEYYAEGEKENKVFKKAKLEIYEITKEEYELANGINVFEYFPTSKDIGLFTDQDGYEEDFLFKLNNQNEGEN